MKHITIVLTTALAVAGCASGPRPLTSQEMAVTSVTDASGCEYITSDTALKAGSDMSLSNSLKRTTAKHGGDSYKIIHTSDGYSQLFGKTTEAEIEIYRCRS